MPCSRRAGSGAFALSLLVAFAADASDPYFETQHFSGSGNCAVCHNSLYDELGEDVSIEAEWSATMMANASRDPLWQAKFASEILRNPQIESLLGDKCTRCHAPMANEEAKKEGSDEVRFFDDGFSDPSNRFHDAAMDGVSCTLCHQIADDGNLGTVDGSSGGFVIEDFTNPSDRPAYGPFANPRVNPMQREAGFKPQFAPHMLDSALCSTCHNLTTPVLDAGGNIVSTTPDTEFPEQMVYSEWENSAYKVGGELETSCQNCHMARADGVNIANRPRSLPPRDDFHRHGFFGGNVLMLDILDANREALDVGDGDFAASIEATRQTLRSAAELVIEGATLHENELEVQVRVINKTGHKLPASFPSRRVFVHLAVTDDGGELVFESGRPNEDGSIAGVDSDSGPVGFEPHYDLITDREQVQVYEPIMYTHENEQTYTLLRAEYYKKDNRIPPKGFDKKAPDLPDQIAVKGAAFDDPNFNDGSDLVTYRVTLEQPVDGGLVVSAALGYQTLSHGFVRDLRQDSGDQTAANRTVARFFEMYDASPIRVETIAEACVTIGQVDDACGTDPGADSGTGGGTDGGADGGTSDGTTTPSRPGRGRRGR